MKKPNVPPADPFAARESSKYENPIASRELILEVVKKHDGPIQFDQLKADLQITEEEPEIALDRRLRAMLRDGQLIKNRTGGFIPVSEASLVRGRITGHPDGFGFLIPDEGGDDLFLSARQMRAVLHGDRAVARIMGKDRRGRPEGAIIEVLERAHEQIVGRLLVEGGISFVAADNKRITQDVMIPPEALNQAQKGQIVVAAITQQPTKRSQPVGKIVEVLGDHMAPGMEIDIAVRSHGLPYGWSDEVIEEADQFGGEVAEDAKQGRIDLRDVPLVTIDGEDARDFDDAVYCEPNGKGGWKLLVAIADVSSYVQKDNALDKEAKLRGTSAYFPSRVIPMLPEVLSNGLCSLNPKVDRLCMVCEMDIDKSGSIDHYDFYSAVMRSHARLTYAQVNDAIVDKNIDVRNELESLLTPLENLYDLYKALRKARSKRGAIDFDSTETKILFDDEQKISQIVPSERLETHKIIEECMIAANVSAARFLKKHKIPALYRVHDGPNSDKLEDLHSFLRSMALTLGGGDKPTPKHYSNLLDKIKDRPDAHMVQTVLLRSLMQAVYAPDEKIGHFGLAHDDYAHFTSPIRRYPDLLVHRAIRHITEGGTADDFVYSREDMVQLGEHCSMTERRADEASYDVQAWLKCEYMQERVGETYDGKIASVTGFGLFVELNDIYVEGLVHITSLANDYYQFDSQFHTLTGEHSKVVFGLGDEMEVKVARVDLDERKIDFMPIGLQEVPKEKLKKSGKGKRRKKR